MFAFTYSSYVLLSVARVCFVTREHFGLAHAPHLSQRHSNFCVLCVSVNLVCLCVSLPLVHSFALWLGVDSGFAHATLLFTNTFEYSCLVCESLPSVVCVGPNSFPSITLTVSPNDPHIVTHFHDNGPKKSYNKKSTWMSSILSITRVKSMVSSIFVEHRFQVGPPIFFPFSLIIDTITSSVLSFPGLVIFGWDHLLFHPFPFLFSQNITTL